MSAEMEQNPFAKVHESRKKISEWRRESVRIATCSAIDHEDFAAHMSKSMAGNKLMVARAQPTPSQPDDTSAATSLDSSIAVAARSALEPRASAIAAPAWPARDASIAQTARAHLDDSPRSRARPLISARLYAKAAASSPRGTTSNWPELVSRAGCLEDKLNLLGNLVALQALQAGGALSTYSGGRCGVSAADAPGGAGSESELEAMGFGRHYDPGIGGIGNTASHSDHRVQTALRDSQAPVPLHPCDDDGETGGLACAAGDAGEGGYGGLFATAHSAQCRPARGRERRRGVLQGVLPDFKPDDLPSPKLKDAAIGPGVDDDEFCSSCTEPPPSNTRAAAPDAGGNSPAPGAGMTRAGKDAAAAPNIMAMMKATSLLRRKAKSAAEAVAARREAAQVVKRREVLCLYDAYLSEENAKATARLRGTTATTLTSRPGLGAAAGSSAARSIADKMKAAMELVSGFEPVLRLYYPGASRADIKEWCAWCTVPKPSAASAGADRRSQLSEVQRAEVAQLFASYDTDGSGALSLSELQSAFRDAPIAPEEIRRIFENIDEDESGLLELNEFEMLVYQLKIF